MYEDILMLQSVSVQSNHDITTITM